MVEKTNNKANGKSLKKTVQPYNYICVYNLGLNEVDKEQPERTLSFTETIEISVVLIDCCKCDIIDEFHAFVRPVHEPILTNYCIKKTGVT